MDPTQKCLCVSVFLFSLDLFIKIYCFSLYNFVLKEAFLFVYYLMFGSAVKLILCEINLSFEIHATYECDLTLLSCFFLSRIFSLYFSFLFMFFVHAACNLTQSIDQLADLILEYIAFD